LHDPPPTQTTCTKLTPAGAVQYPEKSALEVDVNNCPPGAAYKDRAKLEENVAVPTPSVTEKVTVKVVSFTVDGVMVNTLSTLETVVPFRAPAVIA
jgi:hypothetical protein